MIMDEKMCQPYIMKSNCSDCICNMCFNHIPFGDCSLGLTLCSSDTSPCTPVCACVAFTTGSLAKSVQALQ